jgi:pimeloyl-ACP methyl ester carboxylesterase
MNVGQGFCFSDNKCEGGDYLRDSTTGVPRISGWNILNLTNLFATRDNFRQQVVDLSQLTRVLEGGGTGNFNAQLASAIAVLGTSIDPTRINYAGQSLGGILGTLYASAAPDVHNVVLNVPGADPGSILLLSPSFSAQRAAFLRTLAGQGIAPGSIAFDTFIGISKWILDPADPQNMAFSVMNGVVGTARPADRKALVQYITLDEVVPNVTTTELISAGNRTGIGAAQLDTFLFNPSTVAYPPSCNPQGVCDPTIPSRHGFLLRSPDAPTIQTAQCQVANYVNIGGIGTCP